MVTSPTCHEPTWIHAMRYRALAWDWDAIATSMPRMRTLTTPCLLPTYLAEWHALARRSCSHPHTSRPHQTPRRKWPSKHLDLRSPHHPHTGYATARTSAAPSIRCPADTSPTTQSHSQTTEQSSTMHRRTRHMESGSLLKGFTSPSGASRWP